MWSCSSPSSYDLTPTRGKARDMGSGCLQHWEGGGRGALACPFVKSRHRGANGGKQGLIVTAIKFQDDGGVIDRGHATGAEEGNGWRHGAASSILTR